MEVKSFEKVFPKWIQRVAKIPSINAKLVPMGGERGATI